MRLVGASQDTQVDGSEPFCLVGVRCVSTCRVPYASAVQGSPFPVSGHANPGDSGAGLRLVAVS